MSKNEKRTIHNHGLPLLWTLIRKKTMAFGQACILSAIHPELCFCLKRI